jgi:hypothetical protein
MMIISSGAITDSSNNAITGTFVIGGSGISTVDLSNLDWETTGATSPIVILGNDGDDVITGTNSWDYLIGGNGADTINGGYGYDNIYLTETAAASAPDTVQTIVYEEDGSVDGSGSTIDEYDTVYGFDVSGTITNDKLSLASNTIAADTEGDVDGTDVGDFAMHSIADGILTFKDEDGNAIIVEEENMYDAVSYLEANIADPGTVLGFFIDSDESGSIDSLLVFEKYDNDDPSADTLVFLDGVTGVTLGTEAGKNVVQIIDTTAPEINNGFLTTGTAGNAALSLAMSENVSAIDPKTGFTVLLNGAGENIAAAGGIIGNDLSIALSTELTDADYLLVSYDSETGTVSDSSGNKLFSMLPGAALGGDGDNTIDLSLKEPASDGTGYYISGAYGNDTLLGSTGSDELEGGIGADVMTGNDGEDEFYFEQGDSPTLVFADTNSDIQISDGDTFTFDGLAGDVITDLSSGDVIELNNVYTDYYWSSNLSGVVGDQGYALVTGNYADGVFTVNEASGTDTLVVYDGDPNTLSVSQTGLVILGKTVGNLNNNNSGEITVVVP